MIKAGVQNISEEVSKVPEAVIEITIMIGTHISISGSYRN
jgi:hypothetical protein